VRGANIAQMVNVLQAMILTEGPKMLLTPTYQIYRMYVPFQDATAVPVSFEAGTYAFGDIRVPRVDAVAARGTDGKLWLSLVNVDPNRPARVTATFDGLIARNAAGEILTAATVDAHNTFDRPNQVAPRRFNGRISGKALIFDLSPKSVAVVEVQ
jgi:alpha-N-arabinofuranosidase